MALSIVSESPAESNAPLSIINEEPVGPSRLQRAAEKFSENYPVEPAADIFPAVEPALNLGTALTLGFPAYVGGGLGTLAARGLGLTDEDPQAVGERFARAVTYQPQTEEGKALTGAATYPLSWLQEASVAGGQHVADIAREAGLPDWAAAGAGAFTEAGAQMAPAIAGVFTPRGAAAVRPAAATRPPVEELKEVEPGVYARPAEKPAEAAAEPLKVVNEEPAPKAGAEPLTVAKEEPAPIAPEDRAILVSQRGNAATFAQEAEKAAEQHAETNPELAMRWKQAAQTARADVTEAETKLGAPVTEALKIAKEEPATIKIISKAETGQPFESILMRGQGRETSPYNELVPQEGVLGPGRYTTTDPEFAKYFGPNITEHAVRLENPLVIDSDAQWRALTKAAGWEFPNPISMTGDTTKASANIARLRSMIEADGHDGVVVRVPEEEIIGKTMQKVFGSDQVIEFGQAQKALTAPSTGLMSGTLRSGFDPTLALKAYRESYTPFIGVEAAKPIGKSFGASLRKIFAPASLGPEAQQTANIVRGNLGRQAMEKEQALAQMRDAAAMFDKMPVADNYKFIAAMEGGAKISDPKLADAASQIRNLLDTKRGEVQALGKGQLENFIENYFPHIWADESKAQLLLGRRPLEGSKAFLKPRTYDTFSEGIDAGLKPITNNPVELALLKAQEMDRYIYGQKIFEEMKDAKLAKFVKFGKPVPDGYAKINDKIARVTSYSEEAGGQVIRGEYYAPEGAALIINNHLSPGLRGNGAFDIWRQAGTMMNGAQLGLSGFHMGFTTFDAMTSRLALGLKQASRGDVFSGAGNLLSSFNPMLPVMNLIRGDRLLKAYLGDLKDPGLAPIVDALAEAGGRIKMDDFYRNATVGGFKQALRTERYGAAAKQLLPTIMDYINKPIFEYLVPRQKLGVFFDMAKDALEQNPDMGLADKRQIMGKLWDSVDNRMGELVYDNLFWNRTLKDSLMASVRSVGWNLGTFRELGGGALDVADILKNKGLTDRSAYVLALPFMTGVIGSVTMYLYTGEGPQDMKDMFFPRTGKTRPDGTEDRISLPTYMKDVYEYAHDIGGFIKYGANPTKTLQNKAHPLISTVAQMLSNQDFFGATIRNASSPFVQQLQDEAEYLLKQVMPFSIRNYLQQQKLKEEPATLSGYVTSPSMFGAVPSPGYITKTPEMEESAAITANLNPMERKFRQEIKDGADRGVVIQKMQRAGFMPRDIIYVLRSAQENRPLPRLRAYGESPDDQARMQQLHDLGTQAQVKIMREERQANP